MKRSGRAAIAVLPSLPSVFDRIPPTNHPGDSGNGKTSEPFSRVFFTKIQKFLFFL
jgi:hypothetical protein